MSCVSDTEIQNVEINCITLQRKSEGQILHEIALFIYKPQKIS